MADYPKAKLAETNLPASAGHSGPTIQSNIETGQAKFTGADSIGTNSMKRKTGAGNVGNTNTGHM